MPSLGYIIKIHLIVLTIGFLPINTFAYWDYPIPKDIYKPGSYEGRVFFIGDNHLGEDIKLEEGYNIKAIGPGRIVFYGPATSYGELVVAVEHDLGHEYSFRNAYGDYVKTSTVLSIYGHLRPCAERDCKDKPYKIGDPVTSDNVIGYVNDALHNGHGLEHLHMGIRLSSKKDAIKVDDRYWLRGYEEGTDNGKYFGAASSVIETLIRGTRDPVWEFDSDGDNQGWGIHNVKTFEVKGGFLTLDPNSVSPYLENQSISLSALNFNLVRIQMASNSNSGIGAIYFITNESRQWDEAKKVSFRVSNHELAKNAPYSEYLLDMSSNPNWKGTIEGIRIQPAHDFVEGNSDTIGVDWIRIEKNIRKVPNLELSILPSDSTKLIPGTRQEKIINVQGGGGYTVNTYVRVTKPNGQQGYAYYPLTGTCQVNPSATLQFSKEKTPLYNCTWFIKDSKFKWNEYVIDDKTEQGLWTWEFWYEDIQFDPVNLSPQQVGYSKASYSYLLTPAFEKPVGAKTQVDSYVDLGDPVDEQRHNLKGWYVINPGLLPAGLDSDVTSRYQQLRSNNSVEVFVPQVGRSYTLSFRTEDGLCDDSFDVYINGSGPLYRYRHRTSSQVYPLHKVVVPSTLFTGTTVTVTFVNVASDSCGRAATYFVRLD